MNALKLRQDILDELEFETSVSAAHIGVAVEAGVATLSGHVGNYAEKLAAVEAASITSKAPTSPISASPSLRSCAASDWALFFRASTCSPAPARLRTSHCRYSTRRRTGQTGASRVERARAALSLLGLGDRERESVRARVAEWITFGSRRRKASIAATLAGNDADASHLHRPAAARRRSRCFICDRNNRIADGAGMTSIAAERRRWDGPLRASGSVRARALQKCCVRE
jgi:hypothetical protein